MFSRFQRREIMCYMVKINDLEERAEPPIRRTMGASTPVSYKGDAIDVEESVGLQEEVRLVAQFSLGGAHGGT